MSIDRDAMQSNGMNVGSIRLLEIQTHGCIIPKMMLKNKVEGSAGLLDLVLLAWQNF